MFSQSIIHAKQQLSKKLLNARQKNIKNESRQNLQNTNMQDEILPQRTTKEHQKLKITPFHHDLKEIMQKKRRIITFTH